MESPRAEKGPSEVRLWELNQTGKRCWAVVDISSSLNLCFEVCLVLSAFYLEENMAVSCCKVAAPVEEDSIFPFLKGMDPTDWMRERDQADLGHVATSEERFVDNCRIA